MKQRKRIVTGTLFLMEKMVPDQSCNFNGIFMTLVTQA